MAAARIVAKAREVPIVVILKNWKQDNATNLVALINAGKRQSLRLQRVIAVKPVKPLTENMVGGSTRVSETRAGIVDTRVRNMIRRDVAP